MNQSDDTLVVQVEHSATLCVCLDAVIRYIDVRQEADGVPASSAAWKNLTVTKKKSENHFV